MADEALNTNATGDVLGSVDSYKKDVSEIQSSVSSIDRELKSIGESFDRFVHDNRHNNSSTFTSNASDTAYEERVKASKPDRQQSNKNKKTATSSSQFIGILNGFEEALTEYLGIPYLGDDLTSEISNIGNNLKENLSKSLGVSSDELGKTISKAMTEAALDKMKVQIDDGTAGKTTTAFVRFGEWYGDVINESVESAKAAWDSVIEKSDVTGKEFLKTKFVSNVADHRDENTVNYVSNESNSKDRVDAVSSQDLEDIGNTLSEIFDAKDTINDVKDVASKIIDRGSSSTTVKATTTAVDVASDVSKASTAASAASDAASAVKSADAVVDTMKTAKTVATAAKTAVSAINPAALAATVGIEVLTTLFSNQMSLLVSNVSSSFEELKNNFSELWSDFFSGTESMRSSYSDSLQTRIQEDVKSYLNYAYEIQEEAAQKIYSLWEDEVLELITATQGYTKSDYQDLLSAYASRLEEEGLTSVVSSTTITEMLESILKSGLSGAVAEEFAYMATVLNEAIPTEDFTSYAESYAALVSNYMSLGYTQTEALEYANEQLEIFASSTLTASREISGGLTTSLTNVSDLFDSVVTIAQTAGTTDTTELSSALTTVQAIAGQVSSSVGDSIVSQIVEATTGGNDTTLTALRSLAGTGASNTAFLQALVSDPQSVLATLFSNLSDMIDTSSSNYMEVAESLSSTFGVSAEALVRVDWDALVDALNSNTASATSLEENMSLLESGETTTSKEQQVYAQINEYLLEEGLSYVLDNEVARAVQEHLWDQELAADMMDATYSVSIVGDAMDVFESLKSTLYNIANFLTFGTLGAVSTVESVMDYSSLLDEIKEMMEESVVGEGNSEQLSALTTYSSLYSTLGILTDTLTDTKSTLELFQSVGSSTSVSDTSGVDSKYTWRDSGKSSLAVFDNYTGANTYTSSLVTASTSASSTSAATNSTQLYSSITNWLDSVEDAVENGVSFSDWYSSAVDYGLNDVSSTLSELGYSSSDIESVYTQAATDYATELANARNDLEEEFWNTSMDFINVTYPTDRDNWLMMYETDRDNWIALYQTTVEAFTLHLDEQYADWRTFYEEMTATTHEKLQYGNDEFDSKFTKDYLAEWKDYYIGNHTYYKEQTNYASTIDAINAERQSTGEAVLALAEQLTTNYKSLEDPTVQTNVLLAQCVTILQAILTAQTSSSGLTLPTALSALGLNISTSS